MLELQRLGLMEHVDVISGVSGGSLAAAYYGLGPERFQPSQEQAVREVFGYNIQKTWLWRWLLPQNIFRYWFTDFTRSDIMVQVFNNHLYQHKTFADLRPYPKLLMNSTLRNDHTRFTFTDERFNDTLHSNLAKYEVANAVNASSAFPGVLDDITLQGYTEPSQYFHLYDGGPKDNLGVQAILEFLIRNIAGTNLDTLFPDGCMIFVVDASPALTNDQLSQMESDRTWLDYFANTNAIDASDVMLGDLRTRILRESGIRFVDRDIRGEAQLPDPHHCRCEVRHIALRHLLYRADLPSDDDAFVKRVTQIKTKFWVSQEEQEDLFRAAKFLMSEIEESKLLPDESMKIQCGSARSQFKK